MHLDVIHFRNLYTIQFATRFNLLIGNNGSGKTSILHRISIALKSLLTDDWKSSNHAIIINGKSINSEVKFTSELINCFKSSRIATNASVVLPVLGYYGTGRVWKQKKLKKVKTTLPGSRFLGYLNCLDPASDEKRPLEWFKTRELVALQKQKSLTDLEVVRQTIIAVIPDAETIYWDLEADQLAIRFGQRIVWFRQLSDGYRNMLGLVADIAERCVTLNPQLGSEAVAKTAGVVLIDEIDLHLHPKWQRRIVTDLLNAFPKIQFIATTHSPFIIQSLSPSSYIKLHNLDDEKANDFVNKSVEDITEEVQGVVLPQRSQRFQDMMTAAQQYYQVLKQSAKASPEEINRLKCELDRLMLPFSDDPAYQAFLQMQRSTVK